MMEVPRYSDQDLEVRSNDRYQYKPEMIISQSVALDQNEEILKLNEELNYLKQSMEDLKYEQEKQTLNEIRKSQMDPIKREGEGVDYFNPNSIDILLKHRQELDANEFENPVKDYQPEKENQMDNYEIEMKNRKEKVIKNRLTELKN